MPADSKKENVTETEHTSVVLQIIGPTSVKWQVVALGKSSKKVVAQSPIRTYTVAPPRHSKSGGKPPVPPPH